MNPNLRKNNRARVDRRVSKQPRVQTNTIEGPMYVMVTKPCNRCKVTQPINNFYFKSGWNPEKCDENDIRSRRHICVTCWDELN